MVTSAVHPAVEAAAPLREAPARAYGLPLATTSFVGREVEVEQILRRLAPRRTRTGSSAARLLTVTGPGGVGKTRLALTVASLLAERGETVTYVPLASLQDATAVPHAIAAAFGLMVSADRAPLEAVSERIGNRRWVLLLDNCEHVLEAAAGVGDLLAVCAELRIVATSRTRLRLSAEHVLPLEPLPLPDREAEQPLAELQRAPAIRLFVERAQEAGASLELNEASVKDVVAICRQLDGLPLAIELAAARTRVLSPQALLARLTHRLRLLGEGPRDVPDRLRTMRDAIAWSYDLLSAEQQAVFRAVSVFAGGFTVEAAEQLTNGDVVDCLDALLEGSLLQRTRQSDGEWRFTQLEMVREFAQEQLAVHGEDDSARQAHARSMHDLVARAELHRTNTHPDVTYDRLASEHENLRAAITWSWEHDPEDARWLIAELWPFWRSRGHQSEARARIERALANMERDATPVAAKLLCGAGILAYDQDDSEGTRLLKESVDAWRLVGDAEGLAEALTGLGEVQHAHGDGDGALPLWEEARALYQQLGDFNGEAWIVNELGFLALDACDFAQARMLFEEALALARRTDDPEQCAPYLMHLGGIAGLEGNFALAEALSAEAIALWRHNGFRNGLVYGLTQLAEAIVGLGEPERALAPLRESMEISLETGNKEGVAFTFAAAARAAAALAQPELAVRLLAAEEVLHEEIGIPIGPPTLAERDTVHIPPLREQLGAARFDAAWQAGRSLPLTTAIALARSLGPPIDANSAAAAKFGLTLREIEVLRLLVNGESDKDLADVLFISPRTASTHVATILGKLGVDSRTAAVACAHREHLV